MNWIGLHVRCAGEMRDILLAELSNLPFDTFEENDDRLSAYCSDEHWQEDAVKEILTRYNQSEYSIEEIERVNWNEEWEKNYDPILIGDQIRVRATFHEPSSAPIEIIIQPKMSFGTGHHATTHLLLEYQLGLDHREKKVLDVGCGTGVLAIMARKMGASDILAIDIEDWCVENSLENFALNQCPDIIAEQKELNDVKTQNFDIILANITKGVHQEIIDLYHNKLVKGGILLLSGFFSEDVDEVKNLAETNGFRFTESASHNGWARVVCHKL